MSDSHVNLGSLVPVVDTKADGTIYIRAGEPLEPYPRLLTDRLARYAELAPSRQLLTWPASSGRASLTYQDAYDAVQRVGQALLDRGLSADRPLAILSGNDREHLLLALAAQHVGIPYAPVSPAYALVSTDYGTLRQVLDVLQPGLLYAADARFRPAIAAAAASEVETIDREGFDALLTGPTTADVEQAHRAIDVDAVAKILFTSGSTGTPKGVINTHRMICSNQQMILQTFKFLGDKPPVLVDWLPWHHTFGGNHNVGLVVYNGGTLHVDSGRPMPGAFGATVELLRQVTPTVYMNVPKGFEELLRALSDEPDLARRFFSEVDCLFYAAAGLSQHVAEGILALATATAGRSPLLLTGLGATETAPMAFTRTWDSPLNAAIGLPVPGLGAKLVPLDHERFEVRVRGDSVTPGYWRRQELTRAAFDDAGYYCMGDAVRLAVADDPRGGLVFDGRIAEDFKMSSGTWVRVGPLRARIVRHFAPYIRDAVITGHDRNELGMLAVPDVEACRELCSAMPADAPAATVLAHPNVRERLQQLLEGFAQTATGSSTRIMRAILVDPPPLLDAHEVTDKGSLNQRALLKTRTRLVDALYSETPPSQVITYA